MLQLEGETPPKLVRFLPRFRGGEAELRHLFLPPREYEWVHKHVKAETLRESKSVARVLFGEFVKGNRVNDWKDIKRVRDINGSFDHDIWAITPRFKPQYRFFGAFSEPNWFVILCKQERDYLGDNQARWNSQIEKAKRTWDAMFPGLPRFRGTLLEHYITFNAEHKDGRW